MSLTHPRQFRQVTLLFMLLMIGLSACSTPPTITLGPLILSDDFDEVGQWQAHESADIVVMPSAGRFHFDIPTGGYYLTANGQKHTDIILEVTTRALSDDRSNGYGLVCRAQPDGDGYYFLIGSDGSATLRRARGGEVEALLSWTKTRAVHSGSAENTLRAACISDRLMMWVNGEFIGETRDHLYAQGETGLVAVTTHADERLTVDFSRLRGYSVP